MARICERAGAELVLPFRPGDDPAALPMDISRLYLDPMVGFGTTREEDVELLRSVGELAKVPGKDLAGRLAIAVWSAVAGASVVRVHDVLETVQALRVVEALKG